MWCKLVQVSKLELAYKALNATQQLAPDQQSDALTACISREFPAHRQDAPGDAAVDDACMPTADRTDIGTAAANDISREGQGLAMDAGPCQGQERAGLQTVALSLIHI